jgi:hypothetical protein
MFRNSLGTLRRVASLGRVLATAAIVIVAATGCSSGPGQSASRPIRSTHRSHAPKPGCVELRFNFRPLIKDVRAATDTSPGYVHPRRALRRLGETISGLHVALRSAHDRLVRARIQRVIRLAGRLRGPISQQQLVLRLGVLSEAYSAARTACRA